MNVRLRSKDSKPPPSNTRIGLKCPLHDFGRPTFNIKTQRNQANQDSRPKAKAFSAPHFVSKILLPLGHDADTFK